MNNVSMNWLEEADTLEIEAAVTFLDSLETNEMEAVKVQARVGSIEVSDEDRNCSASDSSTPRHSKKSISSRKPRRKRKCKPGYSTEQGRRKKAEVLALRREVLGLEGWLARLQERKSSTQGLYHMGPNTPLVNCSGHQLETDRPAVENARKEFQMRQHSESINHALKGILANQVKVKMAVLATLRQTPILSESDLQLLSSSKAPESLRHIDYTPALINQLAERVTHLYLDCDSVFPKEHLPSFGCRLQPLVDKYHGRTMEIVARTQANCSINQASDIIWKEMSTVRTYPDKVYRYMTERGPDAVAKGFNMTLRSKQGFTAVNGLQFMKKFEEEDRIVQVRAYTLLLPTEGVHLRGHAWTVISKSAADSNQSDVKFYLQLFLETQSGFSAVDSDNNFIQEVGLEAWSLMMRTYSIWLLELVMAKTTTVYV